jgi:hypothetical protein
MYFKINLSKLIILFYFCIFLSILTMSLNYNYLIIFNSLLFIFALLYLLIFVKIDIFFKIFITLLVLLNLSTLTSSWDARSIWLFKAKIFFYEDNFFNIFSHPQFSHPTYPFIGSIFASMFAKSLNIWNEVFPKIGIFFLFIPPLLFLSTIFIKNYLYAFLSLTLFVFGKYFINGEIDGLISIYFLTSLILTYEIIYIKDYNTFKIIIIFFNNIILSLLKFEGTVMVFLFILIYLFYFILGKKIELKKLLLLKISIIPSIMWFLYSSYINKVFQLNDNSFSIKNLFFRIENLESLILIISFFLSDQKFLLSIIFYICFFLKVKNRNLFYLTTSIIIFYIIILIVVYLSTNFDLFWHLNSSANRVIKPIIFVLFTVPLYCICLNKLK